MALFQRFYFRQGLARQYVLNPKAASNSIRNALGPVFCRRGSPLPIMGTFTVMREPMERILSAFNQVIRERTLPCTTVGEFIKLIEQRGFIDLHLVPQAQWIDGCEIIIPMVDGWKKKAAAAAGIKGAIPHKNISGPKFEISSAEENKLAGLYVEDFTLWERIVK